MVPKNKNKKSLSATTSVKQNVPLMQCLHLIHLYPLLSGYKLLVRDTVLVDVHRFSDKNR